MNYEAAVVFNDGVTRIFNVSANEVLMDAAMRNGVNLPLDCREGVCATCKCLRESGDVEMDFYDDYSLTEDEVAKGHVLSCQTRLKSNASFFFDMDSAACNVTVKSLDATVKQVQQVSEAAMILDVTVDEEVSYLPGQYARIKVPGTDQTRAYSFADAKAVDGVLRFIVRLLPDGVMSNYLRERCQPGDVLSMELPYGAFYLRESSNPLVLIAGGTGLSAILSMLDQLRDEGRTSAPVHVIYGARKEEDLCEVERLQSYSQVFADYRLDIVLNEAGPDWTGKQGFVTDVLNVDELQQSFDAYLCGPPGMIDATCDWFSAREAESKLPAYNLYFEKFNAS